MMGVRQGRIKASASAGAAAPIASPLPPMRHWTDWSSSPACDEDAEIDADQNLHSVPPSTF